MRQAEEQILAAKQVAESANEAKSRFLATMSHEIRTPMNGVLGMTELVLRTPLSDQQRSYVSIVKQSANALLMLLNGILDRSKIEAGRMELEHIPFSLNDVVVEAGRLLAVNASQKGLELICRIAPQIPNEMLGDPNRIRQIIVNLLGNAIKFTAHGEVLVDLCLESRDNQKAVIHGVVQDTGIGIAKDKLGTVFEAFRQSDSSTTRKFGGTGLGLSISVQLVELMHGRIWVESELGVGTGFHFEIPLEIAATHDASNTTSPATDKSNAILISSNANARRTYGEMLEACDLTVRPANDIDHAIEQLAECKGENVSLIVVDMGAAQTFDAELAGDLQTAITGRKIAIIFLIPAGQVEIAERCRQLGLTHCLVKPIKRDEMVALVKATQEELLDPGHKEPAPEPVAATRLLRILVADDSPVNQEVAGGLLEIMGHTVQLANDGQEAVDAFKRGGLDIIFMDAEMPVLDGLAATRVIRQLEETMGTHIAIVGLSAHALVGFREQCLEAGMDGYITKPILPEELFGSLNLANATSIAPVAECV